MTIQELRELDAWIAEHVMGWRGCRSGFQSKSDPENDAWLLPSKRYRTVLQCSWKPSTDSGNAMDVLKKCAENGATIQIYVSAITGKWCCMRDEVTGVCEQVIEESETLELTICKIAKQLFSQTTK